MSNDLSPEDEAAWAKVAATVRPLGSPRQARARRHDAPPAPPAPPPASPQYVAVHGETLDSGWDRRLARGRAGPQLVIDLHGLSRAAARELLYRRVAEARARALRVVLVITGKGGTPGPAPADLVPGLGRGHAMRGTIRAELPRWLGESGLSMHIAAVRRAHPQHGGSGAIYLILRR